MQKSPVAETANRLTTTVIVARHGERLDYTFRASGKNWIPTTLEPWNPPLTETGCLQSYKLGTCIPSILRTNKLSSRISAVYSSPLIRCLQTSSNIIRGIVSVTDNVGDDYPCLQVRAEEGLIESLHEDWYRSWCLPGSNSTWGYRNPNNEVFSDDSLHCVAKIPIQSGVLTCIRNSLPFAEEGDVEPMQTSSSARKEKAGATEVLEPMLHPILLDTQHTLENSVHPITVPYQWGNFEPYEGTKDRLLQVVEALAEKHKGETIILCSHGGPVTHLYESLLKIDPKNGGSRHGPSRYTCTSVYTRLEDGSDNATQPWKNLMVNDISHLNDDMRSELPTHWN
mmetsp:Transcript_1200/g.1437  ORF Transcript_1200/g.1437 Transcript_1200/m.1437 type:complete len:340 (+) Transcript_1200:129-1148(+)